MTGNPREHGDASIQGHGFEKRDWLGSAIVGLWVAPEGGEGVQKDGSSCELHEDTG